MINLVEALILSLYVIFKLITFTTWRTGVVLGTEPMDYVSKIA